MVQLAIRVEVFCGTEEKFEFEFGKEVVELLLYVADDTIRGYMECHGY
jgi:hypothetical protein